MAQKITQHDKVTRNLIREIYKQYDYNISKFGHEDGFCQGDISVERQQNTWIIEKENTKVRFHLEDRKFRIVEYIDYDHREFDFHGISKKGLKKVEELEV